MGARFREDKSGRGCAWWTRPGTEKTEVARLRGGYRSVQAAEIRAGIKGDHKK